MYGDPGNLCCLFLFFFSGFGRFGWRTLLGTGTADVDGWEEMVRFVVGGGDGAWQQDDGGRALIHRKKQCPSFTPVVIGANKRTLHCSF